MEEQMSKEEVEKLGCDGEKCRQEDTEYLRQGTLAMGKFMSAQQYMNQDFNLDFGW